MLDEIIRRVALEMLVKEVRDEDGLPPHPGPPGGRPIDLFWDLKYIYLFGMPKVPPAQGPGRLSWDAQSDAAALAQRVQVLEAIVFDLVGRGQDPSPQPSTQSVLLDPKVRLESVERLTKRFESGLKQLMQERDFLTTKIG